MKRKIDAKKVKEAIQIALPFYAVGGENTPSEETMMMLGSARRFLYEQLGFIKELKEECEDLDITFE